jgi:hypothetical protein
MKQNPYLLYPHRGQIWLACNVLLGLQYGGASFPCQWALELLHIQQ